MSKHRGRDRSRDAVVREVYSQHITSYPDMVDHYENMVDVPNYFKVLGVPRSASREQVQESYRQLAFAFHPDRFGFEREGGSERASEMIKLLAEARSVLYDSANRSEYQRNIPNDVNLYPTESWVEHLPQG